MNILHIHVNMQKSFSASPFSKITQIFADHSSFWSVPICLTVWLGSGGPVSDSSIHDDEPRSLPSSLCLTTNGRIEPWAAKNRYLGLAYLSPYIIGLLVFTAFPFAYSFYLSFTDYSLMSSPEWVGLDNYTKLFTRDRTFDKSLKVTLIYVFSTVPLKLVFALFIAVILNYKLKAINFFRTAYYVPSILGGSIAIAVLWRYVFADTGLVNMVLGAVGIEGINWFGDPDQCALYHHVVAVLAVWLGDGDLSCRVARCRQVTL